MMQSESDAPGIRGDEDWTPSAGYWKWAAEHHPVHTLDGNPGSLLCGTLPTPDQKVYITPLGRYATCPPCAADPRGKLPLSDRRTNFKPPTRQTESSL